MGVFGKLVLSLTLLLTLAVLETTAQEAGSLYTGNPIVPNIGLDDGHMRAYGDRLYNYACHDYSPDSSRFILKMWWVWSTNDLLTWTCESSLSPTVIGFPEGYTGCWATDAISRNGKYYWYLCNPLRTYVVRSDTPIGPWESPLGSEALMEGRDPAIFTDDDGKAYLVTGVWDYDMAELSEDMISLEEEPRKIEIIDPRGPYNHDGTNTEEPTDDKPYLHKYNGKYYLSWGCYYAMSDHVYGPYTYKGCFVVEDRTDPEFQQEEAGLTHDRHGSFFQWKNQSYFNCNDLSSNGAHRFWRNTIIMYIHYRDNGEIEPAHIDRIGVGQYDAAAGPIEAENYYEACAAKKRQNGDGGFEMRGLHEASSLAYAHVMNLLQNSRAKFRIRSDNPDGGMIEVWSEGKEDQLLGTCRFSGTGGKYKIVKCRLNNTAGMHDIRLEFKGMGSELLRLDWIQFSSLKKNVK